MGSNVSTCTDSGISSLDLNKTGLLLLKKDRKTPNFMQKVKINCKLKSNPISSTVDADAYTTDIVTDFAMVIPLGVASLLVLVLFVLLIVKMRRRSAHDMQINQ